MPRMQVIRGDPRPRDLLQGLTGSLDIKVRVDRPVHIGTGERYAPSLDIKQFLNDVRATPSSTVEDELKKLQKLATSIEVRREVLPIFSTSSERRPTIPGSSLKGAVRSRLELTFKGREGKVPSCFSVVGGPPIQAQRGSHGWRHQAIYPSSLEDRGPPCDFLRFGTVCKVCDIFGAPGLSSRVHFPTLIFDRRPSIFKTSAGDVEVIPKGSEAEGKITFINMEPEELGLVLIGMGNMRPLLLGFGKYKFHDGERMGEVVIEPKAWTFIPPSIPILSGIGFNIDHDGGNVTEVGRVKELWNLLVAKALENYGGYLEEVNVLERKASLS